MVLMLAIPAWASDKSTEPSLEQILSFTSPARLYAKTYQAFSFSGSIEVILTSDDPESSGPGKQREASWNLRWDEHGNFHLTKSSLVDSSALDLIYWNHQFYLRQKSQKTFRSVSPQAEFFTWVNLPFRDMFDIWKKLGIRNLSEFKREGEHSCVQVMFSKLCIDPDHHLPLQGQYMDRLDNNRTLHLHFSVVPASPGTLIIEPPNSSGSPGK